MIKTSILLFFCLFFNIALKAQLVVMPDSILFSGVVVDASTSSSLSDVHCYNRKMVTVTDRQGRFQMYTIPGDTVSFSYVGFRSYKMIVPDTLTEKEYMVGIFLSPDTVRLGEVLILRRFNDTKRQNLINARRNMAGLGKSAFAPVKAMDADMNQRMVINQFARNVEMKGLVDVKLGVGTHSLEAWELLKLQKKMQEQKISLNEDEIGILKNVYFLEKRRKPEY